MDGPWGLNSSLPRSCPIPREGSLERRTYLPCDLILLSFAETCCGFSQAWLDTIRRKRDRPLARCYSPEGLCACEDLVFYRSGPDCLQASWLSWTIFGIIVVLLLLNAGVFLFGIRVTKRAYSRDKQSHRQVENGLPIAVVNCLISLAASLVNLAFCVYQVASFFQHSLSLYVWFVVSTVADYLSLASLFLLSIIWATVSAAAREEGTGVVPKSLRNDAFTWVLRGVLATFCATTVVLYVLFVRLWDSAFFIAARCVTVAMYTLMIVALMGSSLAVYRVTFLQEFPSDTVWQRFQQNVRDSLTILSGQAERRVKAQRDGTNVSGLNFLLAVRQRLVHTTTSLVWSIVAIVIGEAILLFLVDKRVDSPALFAAVVVQNLTSLALPLSYHAVFMYYDVPSQSSGDKESSPKEGRVVESEEQVRSTDSLLRTTILEND